MIRDNLEKHQVFIYLASIALGLLLGSHFPESAGVLERVTWPVLGLLMFATFNQVPLTRLRSAFTDKRFMGVAVLGNFVVLPLVVWLLLQLAPDIPAVQLGIVLVLLVPCTDWFITFTHLGGGNTRSAIAFTPLSLLFQLVLLPVYLWLFLGVDVAVGLVQKELVVAFVGLILLPLLAALITQKWVERRPSAPDIPGFLGVFPVPLLALVVFSIAAAQVSVVLESVGLLGHLALVFVAFLLIAGLLSRLLAHLFRLPVTQGRVLAFSLGSRNSFVMLPLALSLPASYELTVVVIVLQSLVELFGMATYLWWVPKKLHPDA